jgi:hypothetical protein
MVHKINTSPILGRYDYSRTHYKLYLTLLILSA